MQVITEIQALRDALTWRRSKNSVGLVITKGSLHQGHTALIGASLAGNPITVVACYAGTNLFTDAEAAQQYPHNPKADEELLAELGVDILFRPAEADLYPDGETPRTRVDLPLLGPSAEDPAGRNHSIELVTLALKLCQIVQPQNLVYGEKHFQQLVLTRRMVQAFNLPLQVRSVPIVREPDGLAVATRNELLSSTERAQAPVLYRTLRDVGEALKDGASHLERLEQTARVALKGAGFRTDYVRICDARTLGPVTDSSRALRILGAARLGEAQLQDNIAFSR
ncbi:MAG: pantoate--beta-alanine ligase [Pseudomonadota bacterium]